MDQPPPGAARPAPPHEDVPLHYAAGPAPTMPGARGTQYALLQQWRSSQVSGKTDQLQLRLAAFTEWLKSEHVTGAPLPDMPALSWRGDTVITAGGVACNAHHIHLSNSDRSKSQLPLASACACPTLATFHLHMEMLFKERPSVLVVLARDDEREGNVGGYFRQSGMSGTDGTLRVDSRQTKPDFLGAAGLPMQVEFHEMTLRRAVQGGVQGAPDGAMAEVKVPVLYVADWPDGTALDQGRMTLLLDQLRGVESHDGPDGEYRQMMVHCKEGVGRTGQLIGTRLLQEHGDKIASTEDLIRAMRQSRSTYMAYVPGQQIALAEAGLALGIPVLASERGCSVASVLEHIGIDSPFGMPEYSFGQLMPALGMAVSTQHTGAEHAPSLISTIEHDAYPLLVETQKNGETVGQMLWRTPAAADGKNIVDGRVDPRTPMQFLRDHVDGTAFDSVQLTQLRPSKDAAESAAFSQLPQAQIHGHFLSTAAQGDATRLDRAEDLSDFLGSHGIVAHAIDLEVNALVNEQAVVSDALRKSKNVIIEFNDNRRDGSPTVRYVFNDLDTSKTRALSATSYAQDGEIEQHHFKSFKALAEDMKAASIVSNVRSHVSILSIVSSSKLHELESLREPHSDEDSEMEYS